MSTEIIASAPGSVAPLAFPRVGQARDAESAATVRGHAVGYAAGRQEADRELEAARAALQLEAGQLRDRLEAQSASARDALASAATGFESRLVPVAEELESVVLAAALRLATAIVGHELSDAPMAATAAVRRALSAARRSPVLRVRLHPDDLELVATDDSFRLSFVADPSLARGDAVAETEDGFVDARIDTAISRACAALGVTP